jgi:thiamine pyrophosphate-dependent acetolactate synthase large subunit-like protein
MPDDHALSVAAARTPALQNADVVFLMGGRFNWILHPACAGAGFGQAPRYSKDVRVIQLDIAPEEIGHNEANEVALVGAGKAIPAFAGTGQLNKSRGHRQWFYTKGQAVAQRDRQEVDAERGDDPAADPGRRGAGQLLLRGALGEAMNFRGPALVNVVISPARPASRSSFAGTAEASPAPKAFERGRLPR